MKPLISSHPQGWGFALAFLVVASIGGGTYISNFRLERSFNSVSQSHQAIAKLQNIQSLVEAGQSSAYHYVITGRTERLDIYRRASADIPKRLSEAESLVKNHPRQRKALQQFRRLLAVHQTYLAKIVSTRQTDGFDAAAHWVASEDDYAIRDVLKGVLVEVQQAEAKLLRKRSTSSTHQSLRTKLVLAGAAGVSLVLVAWVFGLLRREKGERLEVESTNQQLETFLRSIVERIPYLVLVKKIDTLRIILANKAATEWLGKSEQDLLGSNDYDFRPREAARLAMQQDQEVIRGGGAVNIPEESLVMQGTERILHTQKVVIPDANGDPAFLLTISEDITQRKQEERMLELSRDAAVQSERLKSEFIRNVSHEIRTPLSIVVGMTSILMDSELSPQQRAFAAKVENAAGGLVKLTKGILDFSKIEAGTFQLELQEMNLRQNVEGILTMLQEQAKMKGIGLVSLFPPSIPQLVVGDPIRLRQVLTELLSNALKFTARGEVIVRVQEEQQTENQLWLTFKVSDTGPGVDEAAQPHLFDPFRQGDGSPTRKFGGTGLGLAISKRIVELMGGKIGFTSKLQEGSTFWCTIPFQKRGVQGQAVKVASLPWTKARVLIVNENDVARQQMRDQLSAWALASETVSNGEAALDLLRREQEAERPFQIVLVDMYLPDMDAVKLARELKSNQRLASTRLVVFTETPLDPTTAATLGFAACITKPLNANTLLDRMAGLIEPRSSSSKAAA